MHASDGCTGLIGRVCVLDPATNTSLNLCDGFGVKKPGPSNTSINSSTSTSIGTSSSTSTSTATATATATATSLSRLAEVEIRCHPVAAHVTTGKCLRVHVASAAFPRWPRDACTRRGDASTVTVGIVVGSEKWPSGVALPLA